MLATNGHDAELSGSDWPAPRRVLGYRSARLASWGLFALAAALAVVFVVHIARFEASAPAPSEEDETTAPVSTEVVVTDSTLTGFDRERQPYSVTAANGVQDAEEPNLVHLETVAGKLHRSSGDILSLSARTALFDTKTDVLALDGNVTLRAAGRFVAEMARAEVTLADKRLRAQTPVTVTFDRGTIAAGGLEITDDGNRVVFFDRARVTFGPQTRDDRLP